MTRPNLTEEERDLLATWLPHGWLGKASEHFKGTYSRSTISRAKLGELARPNWEVLNYLLSLAKEEKQKADDARAQLSTLRA